MLNLSQFRRTTFHGRSEFDLKSVEEDAIRLDARERIEESAAVLLPVREECVPGVLRVHPGMLNIRSFLAIPGGRQRSYVFRQFGHQFRVLVRSCRQQIEQPPTLRAKPQMCG
jgi:hypothetical protein